MSVNELTTVVAVAQLVSNALCSNQSIIRIFEHITDLLTALIGNEQYIKGKTQIPNQSILQTAKLS